jgi:hypothetical protein
MPTKLRSIRLVLILSASALGLSAISFVMFVIGAHDTVYAELPWFGAIFCGGVMLQAIAELIVHVQIRRGVMARV